MTLNIQSPDITVNNDRRNEIGSVHLAFVKFKGIYVYASIEKRSESNAKSEFAYICYRVCIG